MVGVAGGVQDGWHDYVALRQVREENLRLRREILRAQGETSGLGEVKAESERLKHLLEYADRSRPTRFLIAEVIAVGASPHSHVLRIARGSEDGVLQGAAVVAPEGAVGQVAVTTAHYADVQLIVSPTSAVPALSQRTRGRSTVKGIGDSTHCKLEYALRTDDLQDGDLLLTAPGPGFFPKGLPIGRVVNVTKRSTGMFLSADVVPAVNFSPSWPFRQRRCRAASVPGDAEDLTSMPTTEPPRAGCPVRRRSAADTPSRCAARPESVR